MSLPRPKKLSFEGLHLTDAGLRAQVAQGHLAADVGDLTLDGNGLSARAVEALEGVRFQALVTLSLGANRLGDAGATALSKWPALRGLRTLSLAENELTSAGAAALVAEGSTLVGLWGLNLSGNAVGDAAARAIVASPHVGLLQVLNLEKTGLTDVGASLLAGAPALENLRTLYVGSNALSSAGRQALQGSPHLRACRVDFGEP